MHTLTIRSKHKFECIAAFNTDLQQKSSSDDSWCVENDLDKIEKTISATAEEG